MVHKDLFFNGTKLVSITKLQSLIAKPFLDSWKEGLCDISKGMCGFDAARNVAEESVAYSEVVHKEVAQWLTDGSLSDPPHEVAAKIIEEMVRTKVQKILIEPEEIMRCDSANLSGSADHIAEDGEGPFIGDIKVKNSLDVLTGVQGYGYRLLVKHKTGVDIKRMKIWWWNRKTNSLKIKDIPLDPWKKPFMALVTMWNILTPSRKINLAGLKRVK